MMKQSSMHIPYEKLPAVDLTAPKVLSRRNRAENITSKEKISQDAEDAVTVLTFAGLDGSLSSKRIIDADEKYMIETQSANTATTHAASLNIDMRQKSVQKPHYTRLLVFDSRLVFQAACCLPLKVIAASLDGEIAYGRILFNSYAEECGGKLVYEFMEKGAELFVDIKRGESTKAQRIIFRVTA
jgi:hypothetical protein